MQVASHASGLAGVEETVIGSALSDDGFDFLSATGAVAFVGVVLFVDVNPAINFATLEHHADEFFRWVCHLPRRP